MNLPDLVLCKIFHYFDLRERFKLRIICKRWKILIELESRNQTSLLVYGYKFPYGNWPFQKNEIKKNEIVNQLFFEKFCLINNYFTSVKNLYLLIYVFKDVEIKGLQSSIRCFMEKLEKLVIDRHIYTPIILGNYMEIFTDQLKIEDIFFAKLKTFTLIGDFLNENLKLNAPSLENLYICYHHPIFNKIIILPNYEKLKILQCNKLNYLDQKFLNLENLICIKIDPNFELSNFPNLKRLDLAPEVYHIPFIRKLHSQILRNSNDLIITIFGFEYSKMYEKIIEEFLETSIVSRPYTSEYSFAVFGRELIEESNICPRFNMIFLDWKFKLIYDDSVFKKINYLSKFNIVMIAANNLKNIKNLLIFIEKVSGVRSLVLGKCNIDKESKEYFKKVPFIFSLKLQECEFEKKIDFIGDIKNLKELDILSSIDSYPSIENFFESIKNTEVQFIVFRIIERFYLETKDSHILMKSRWDLFNEKIDSFQKFENLNDAYSFLVENGLLIYMSNL